MSSEYREDYYFVLGVREDADQEEIRAAYRRLMKQYHPDLNWGNPMAQERGKRINEAYEVLSDPARRRDHGDWLRSNRTTTGRQHSYGQSGRYDGQRSSGTSTGPLQEDSDVLEHWFHQRNPVSRWLAPGDFLAATESLGSETFICLRATTEYLERSVTEQLAVVKIGQEAKYHADPSMLEYVPDDFRNEKIQVVAERRVTNCASCNGSGWNACPPRVPCSPIEECSACRGSGTMTESCRRCDGDGWIYFKDMSGRRRRCSDCDGHGGFFHGACMPCGGHGRVACGRCGGEGEIACNRCKGSGRVDCRDCGRHGQVIHALIVNISFSNRSEDDFSCEGGSSDGFRNGLRNGLSRADFLGLNGTIVGTEEQTPAQANVVRQRQRTERFGVVSHSYRYCDREFFVNRLSGVGGEGRPRASADLPISTHISHIKPAGPAAISNRTT